jgi:drug/metabolite transporter (DMT)-like permease
LGVLGALGHFCIIKAYNFGDASSLSPLLNTQIFAAALFSSFIFDDPLTTGFIVGALFIISGAVVLWLGHLKRLDSSQ